MIQWDKEQISNEYPKPYQSCHLSFIWQKRQISILPLQLVDDCTILRVNRRLCLLCLITFTGIMLGAGGENKKLFSLHLLRCWTYNHYNIYLFFHFCL